MHPIDYLVIVAVLLTVVFVGAMFARRAGRSTDEYILGGRKMPWWLGGISLVATALNASTMLVETRKIRQDGIAGQWYMWTHVIGSLISTVWFSRLWRRAGFTTPMDFYRARYSGWQAHFTRLFDVVLFGLVLSTIWSAIGLVAMKKIVQLAAGFPAVVIVAGIPMPTDWIVVGVLVIMTMIYTVAGGVHGVVWADVVEFVVATAISYTLMVILYKQAGGAAGLSQGIEKLGADGSHLLRWLPAFGPILIYFIFISPFTKLGHIDPSIQRYLCMKDEREVLFTGLFSTLGSYLLRSWPYYVAGLCGIVLVTDHDLLARFPALITPDGRQVADYEMLLPLLMERYLPPGLVGLMVASFMCAFMGAFAPNILNSASNFIHDFWRSYVVRNRSDAYYIKAGRIYSVILAVFVCVVAISVRDILRLNMLVNALLISSGMVKLLRFVWWRINGTSEVAAQLTSIVSAGFFLSSYGDAFVLKLMPLLGVSGNDGFFVIRQIGILSIGTTVSIIVALATKPEPMEKLGQFYQLLRPFGRWKPVQKACGLDTVKADPYGVLIIITISTNLVFFSAIFCGFAVILANWSVAAWLLALFVCASLVSWRGILKLYKNGPDGAAEAALATRTTSTMS